MNKGVREVRESIMKRKKKRIVHSKNAPIQQVFPAFPQEEEKYGYFPSFLDSQPVKKQSNRFVTNFILKGMLSVLLFFGVAFLLESDLLLFSKAKVWTSQVVTEEFPFARVQQWYQTTFGSPLAITPDLKQDQSEEGIAALPVVGSVKETFQTNGTGIMIAPNEISPVSAWNDGIVIFAGNDRETNKTVVIQHADLSKSTYGLLSSIDVHLYQSVTASQQIGTFDPSKNNESVYFSIVKNAEYIDPVQVIKVDDIP